MRELLLSVLGVAACFLIVIVGVPLMVFGTLSLKGRK